MEPELEEIFVDAPWGKISVLTYGKIDCLTVVMVHGLQDSASTFFPLLEYFPTNLRLILPELPSCGHSSPFPVGQPLQPLDYLPPIKIVVDYFQLENFVFLGHSLGIQLGYFFNAVYPGYVTKFISLDSLSNPPVDSSMFSSWFKWTYENFYDNNNYKMFCSTPESNPSYTFEKALAHIMKSRGLTESAGKAVLKRALIPAGNGLYRFCWDQRFKLLNTPLSGLQYNVDIFSSMAIPHLSVIASKTTKNMIPFADLFLMDAAFANNPNYRLVMVQGSHEVHLNNPEAVASHVVPFLKGEDASIEETYRLVHVYKKMKHDLERGAVTPKL